MKEFLTTKKGKVILGGLAVIIVSAGIIISVVNKKDSNDTPKNNVTTEMGNDASQENVEGGLQVEDSKNEDAKDDTVDFSELTEDDDKDNKKDDVDNSEILEEDSGDNENKPNTDDDTEAWGPIF